MKNKSTSGTLATTITGISHDGRGIAVLPDGKTTFISGALQGEVVAFKLTKKHPRYNEGEVTEVINPSNIRTLPACEHFGVCGGCSMQHMSMDGQIHVKQKILLDQLKHFGRVEPEEILPPISGNPFGYRRKARLGLRYIKKKDRVLIGFREKATGILADINSCPILHPRVGKHFAALASMVQSLNLYDQIPQLEIAIGDNHAALIFRNMSDMPADDRQKLAMFGADHELHIYLQPNSPQPLEKLWPLDNTETLSYLLTEYQLEIQFHPLDFTQVNGEINPLLIQQAMALLNPQSDESVLDLFCGLGNFTLPIARYANEVVGIEGSHEMVRRAQENAAHNNIDNAEFFAANLADIPPARPSWMRRQYHKILLDPSRNGAKEIIALFPVFNARSIVYVSCNPATLARDAGELVHNQGYKLKKVGIINMFPQTSHIEAIALFEK